MNFIRTNLNPKNKNTGDCVVRAIAKAENKEWNDVYKELCEIGFKYKLMPNDKKCYERYLKQNGWVKQKMPRHIDNTKYTLREFIDEYPCVKDGTMVIISVANHLTCGTIRGNLYDTWDCSYKCVGNYWIKE